MKNEKRGDDMKRYLLLVILLFISGCSYTYEELKYRPLATVGADMPLAITIEDIEETFKTTHGGHELMMAGEGAVRDFLEKTIDKHLVIAEGLRAEFDKDELLKEMANKVVVKEATEELYKNEIGAKVKVTDDEIKEAYSKMGEAFEVRTITTYTMAQIDKVLERIKNGEDFSAIAREVSINPYALKGGRLPEFKWSRFPWQIADIIYDMAVDEVRGPMQMDDGWALVKVTARKKDKEISPLTKEMERHLKGVLSRRARQNRKDAFFEELKIKWKAEIRYNILVDENIKKFIADDDKGDDVIASFEGWELKIKDFKNTLDKTFLSNAPAEYAMRKITHALEDKVFLEVARKEAAARGYASMPHIKKKAEMLTKDYVLGMAIRKFIADPINITDEEAKGHYNANGKRYSIPASARISVIMLSSEDKAKEVFERLKSGEEFAAIARKESEDILSAEMGGDSGWINEGEADTKLNGLIFSLQTGEMGMVRLEEKVSFIVKVEEKQSGMPKPFESVSNEIKNVLWREKVSKEMKEWVKQLREVYPIRIYGVNIDLLTRYYMEEVDRKSKEKGETGGHHGDD
ncbi:MAG TPA: hypothetical protein DD641_07730 [Deltaproteobacteria bacterium]|nr:hypothetical protein [Deltaproteobacteria bacterium]